jgi:putative oxidoreductase
MDRIFALAQRVSAPMLRVSLAIILLWIGALKFADPGPVVGLLQASLAFLAFPAFVYLLGVLEVSAALLLLANIQVRYVGFLVMALFAGTLTIFVIAPAVTYGGNGFPLLSLAGEFLLKDLVLLAATVAVVAADAARAGSRAPATAATARSGGPAAAPRVMAEAR